MVTGVGINGYRYDPDWVTHGTKLGSVVQREVSSRRHPYHQHVFPFQLTSVAETDYVKIGDWQDVHTGDFTMRFAPQKFTGKMMLHCHILTHEDQGAMGIETISDANGTCFCGDQATGDFTYVILFSVTSLVLGCYLVVGFVLAGSLDKRSDREGAIASEPVPDLLPDQFGQRSES
jgi:hypothetical protein